MKVSQRKEQQNLVKGLDTALDLEYTLGVEEGAAIRSKHQAQSLESVVSDDEGEFQERSPDRQACCHPHGFARCVQGEGQAWHGSHRAVR